MLGFLPIRVFVKGVLSGLVELLLRRFHGGVLRGFLFGQFALAFGGHAIAFAGLLFCFLRLFFGELFLLLQNLDGLVGFLQRFLELVGFGLVAAVQRVHVLLRKIARTGRGLLYGEAFETFGDVRDVVLLRAGLHDDMVAGFGVLLRASQSVLKCFYGCVVVHCGVKKVVGSFVGLGFLQIGDIAGFRRRGRCRTGWCGAGGRRTGWCGAGRRGVADLGKEVAV